ncbi:MULTISPECIES: cupin-like domain-containing protein [unclassified Sphingomonas]|uniref:cupin-like domain-containing protein n=1 Tax=unclassified Sphingomonas TaxID=196159 RepID=UPI0006F9D981|nr:MULTISPECIES: cupin-like domain-containing protein [unclassified Sphingomonas]KQM28550.1 cupin [Sphingomonas sp. Leaf9]KQM45255.1 cupin [Sphingomonas sp. Leaf11]
MPRPVRSIDGADAIDLPSLLAANEPVVLRGFAADWPLVAAGRAGAERAIAYLKQFDGGRPIVGYTGEPAIGGRFFYRDDWTGLNFDAARVGLSAYLDRIASHLDDPDAPACYIGSTDLDTYLPGLRRDNDLSLPPPAPGRAAPLASIWIGNRTVAATHYDLSNNLAVCLVGQRRFTLFPPDQIANLYPGPLEPTPGGQVVSMVDLRAPDLDRYPRFADALGQAQIADLKPGDVLFYPALWWHNVEALDRFNVMINYWWNDAPAFADSPMTTLLHAMLSLRERPAAERAAWAAMFDHYIWRGGDDARAHLPPEIQGDLAPLDPAAARRLRAKLLQRLNR